MYIGSFEDLKNSWFPVKSQSVLVTCLCKYKWHELVLRENLISKNHQQTEQKYVYGKFQIASICFYKFDSNSLGDEKEVTETDYMSYEGVKL